MTNNENNTSPIETGVNRQFFEEVISDLSEKDKKIIGKFKEWANDTAGEVLKPGEKDKVKDYDRLNIKNLPEDWEFKLARIKELESHEVDYLKKKDELKLWTDTFGEKKPEEVQQEIKELTEKNKEIREELITEKENHSLTKNELNEWKTNFLNQNANQVKDKVEELQTQVKEWTTFFDYRELEEIKQEIEELRKRPDIAITKDQFWDDYAQRKSLEQSKLDKEELTREKEKSAKLEQQNQHFLQVANQILKNIRIREYTLANPVITQEEAEQEISNLLEEAEKRYSVHEDDKELNFELSIYPDKKERIKQVLEWIKEARKTQDYQTLYQKWNGDKLPSYNQANDFIDGSLSLLKRYLDVVKEESLNEIASEEEKEGIL